MNKDSQIPNFGVKIKVVGIGGAGGNAINYMMESGNNQGIEFIAMNTDAQDLLKSRADIKIQLGEKITKGLGAGANPEIGKMSAEEDRDAIKTAIADSDLLFLTAGVGGGTGTGATPVVAEIARDLGILTVAVITKPFSFEGKKRSSNAEGGIDYLGSVVDTLVVIPNDKLFELPNKNITLINAFEAANSILKIGIHGVSDLITKQGYINLDFADIKSVISNSGVAMLGFGYAEGEDRAKSAADQALTSPLLEKPIKGAKKILLNISGGANIELSEVSQIADMVTSATGNQDTEVIFGSVLDDSMDKGIKVTIIATGFEDISGSSRSYSDVIDMPSFLRDKK